MTEQKLMSRIAFRGMALWLRLRERFQDPEKRLADARLETGQTVLDYGCGIGSYTIPAAKMVGRSGTVYALDIHPSALEATEERARRGQLGNIRTILSGLDTGLQGNTVDVVLLYDVLHAVQDRQALLRELHRVLKPGGKLSILPDHMAGDEVERILTSERLFNLKRRHGEIFEFNRTAAT